jgi:hypothetical protein
MMADYQGRWQVAKDWAGRTASATLGDGWLRLLTFRLDGTRPNVRVRTWSTQYGQFSADMATYAGWYKGHEGMGSSPTATTARDDFSFDLPDFRARFGTPN